MLVQIDIAWFVKQLIVTKVQIYVPLEGCFCTFENDHSNNLPTTNLYFLKKSGDLPLRPTCSQNFSDLKV